MIKQKGTTLVEVLVATALLVSVTGIISLSLVVVFDGYAWTQKRSDIDQDGQYILARMKYASSQQNPQILVSQPIGALFSGAGAQFVGTKKILGNSENIYLMDDVSRGEYMSQAFDFGDLTKVGSLVAFTQRPTESKLEYQVAIARKTGGSCDNTPYTFVGPDGTSNTRFNTDYFIVPESTDGAGYENPGSCLKYVAYFERGTASPTIFQVLIKR